MNKIQVSTVKMTADCEVVCVNARLISKSIKSKLILDDIADYTRWCEEDGSVRFGPIDEDKVCKIMEVVKPFLDELCDAFEAE